MYEETSRFTIVHRDSSGHPIFIYPHDRETAECLAKSINYSKGYFCLARVQSALLAFATEHEQSEPNAWYKDPVDGFVTVQDATVHFIDTIFPYFCMVAVDSTIRNLDCLGGQASGKWDGRFDPRNHCILLNASRVRDMVGACERVMSSSQRSDYDNINYRTFLFNFTNTFFREICSLFVTFLTKGRPVDQGEGRMMMNKDEFAQHMEIVLFGGTMTYYRDPIRDTMQSGIPHIVTKVGARRVSQYTVDTIVDSGNIGKEYPIILGDQIIDTRTMQTLGINHPPAVLTDPMNSKIMQQFKMHQHRARVDTQSASHGSSSRRGYVTQAADMGRPRGSDGRW